MTQQYFAFFTQDRFLCNAYNIGERLPCVFILTFSHSSLSAFDILNIYTMSAFKHSKQSEVNERLGWQI